LLPGLPRGLFFVFGVKIIVLVSRALRILGKIKIENICVYGKEPYLCTPQTKGSGSYIEIGDHFLPGHQLPGVADFVP
jgi:hypothetical protein